MADVNGIKTDENLAAILDRLKKAKPSNTVTTSNKDSQKEDVSLMQPIADIHVDTYSNTHKNILDLKKEPEYSLSNTELQFSNDIMLPWFKQSDKDNKLLHYISLDSYGNLLYNSIKPDRPANDIASLKLKDNFVCDIDYYKNRHYVLSVQYFDSNLPASKSYTCEESVSVDNITVDDIQYIPDCVQVPDMSIAQTDNTDSFIQDIAENEKYFHYIVFTDLGTADFITKQDDCRLQFGDNDLNKWFEDVSNKAQIKCARYEKNNDNLSDESESIRDFKYDIIIMHRPGIITLDSVDNTDQDYKLHLQLKNEYNFIPMNKLLGCLKNFAKDSNKTIDDFRRFVNKYFDFVV